MNDDDDRDELDDDDDREDDDDNRDELDDDDKLSDDQRFYRNERLEHEYLWRFIGYDSKDEEDLDVCVDKGLAQITADELACDRRVLRELQKSHPELVVMAYRAVLYEYLFNIRADQIHKETMASKGKTE